MTVWTFGGSSRAVGLYLVRLLKDLGYRAHQRSVSDNRFFPMVANAHSKTQVGLALWGADFPSASDFFLPVLSCRSFYQDPTNTSNYAEFCDPHADQLASRGPGGTAHRPRHRPKAVGPGRPHRHRPGTMGPDPQPGIHHIRLRPHRELPGIPHLWAPA